MISRQDLNQNKKGAFIMARIKIEDVQRDMTISREEMKEVLGGMENVTYFGYALLALPRGAAKGTGGLSIETIPLPE